jgi:hypothetical protein
MTNAARPPINPNQSVLFDFTGGVISGTAVAGSGVLVGFCATACGVEVGASVGSGVTVAMGVAVLVGGTVADGSGTAVAN